MSKAKRQQKSRGKLTGEEVALAAAVMGLIRELIGLIRDIFD